MNYSLLDTWSIPKGPITSVMIDISRYEFWDHFIKVASTSVTNTLNIFSIAQFCSRGSRFLHTLSFNFAVEIFSFVFWRYKSKLNLQIFLALKFKYSEKKSFWFLAQKFKYFSLPEKICSRWSFAFRIWIWRQSFSRKIFRCRSDGNQSFAGKIFGWRFYGNWRFINLTFYG